ncbi:YaiI/YqxD family protein [Allohahella sp. A8]|uniref:YaiI/YqxD family protein n=1 Tax=Allohahella sp. A8 TaxID=3141461 RepID=UPI000C0B1D90|nr:DUF188 domain-containing protein [Hahellaceae bacterium]|tara:strand:+ start:90695 stop:91147 length:453 start_codon:yes stop_codon:yes gene_type:complete
MNIWVDGDACPVVVKEILYRAAERTSTVVTFVANQSLSLPKSKYLKMLQVSAGFDVADNEIVRRAEAGDLVVTSDIPLAAEIVEKGAIGLNPRGERYTAENIKATLNMRDFMDTMRSSGVDTGSTAAFSQADRQRFANSLDSWLAKRALK